MYRFCVAALESKPIRGALKADGITRHALSVSASFALAGLAIVDPIGASHGSLGASEMPRFIAQQQLRPLQEALLAYTSQTAASQANARPSFSTPASNTPPGEGMPPELLSGPELVSGSHTLLTTSEFRSTLIAARRDAGEARALADEMSRRVTEISDRFSAGSKPSGASVASNQVAPRHVQNVAQASVSQQQAAAPQAAGTAQVTPPTAHPPASAHVASASDSSKTTKQAVRKQVAAVTPAPQQAPAQETIQAPVLASVSVPTPSRPVAAAPLPGLMSLGGSTKSVTASIDPIAMPPEDATVTTGVGIATRTAQSGVAERNAPNGSSATAAITPPSDMGSEAFAAVPPVPQKAPQVSDEPKSAAEAYGYVPLSPPKDRSKKQASPQPDPASAAPSNRLPTQTANTDRRKPDPQQKAVVTPKNPEAKAAAKPGSNNQQVAGAAANAATAGEESQEKKGLFSWFKPFGKPFEMPRELSSFGWGSE